jgi:hypothetical protein
MREGFSDLLNNSQCIIELHLLRQITDRNVRRHRYVAACRHLQSGNDFKHCAFTGAIFAYQSNFIPLVYNIADIVK